MTNVNPHVEGDSIYPQYDVTRTQDLEVGTILVKGKIYTKLATGLIAKAVITTTLAKGLFQSRVVTDVASLAGDRAQFFMPKTRIILKAAANITAGDDVVLVPGIITATDSVAIGTKASLLHLGRVFEVLTKDANGLPKDVTALNDFVVVETDSA